MKKILIVDGLETFIFTEKSILRRADLEIFTATSGDEALNLHRAEKMDVIIASLDLPDIGADKLCSIIRNDEELKSVSIIIVCNASDIERASGCKANSYIAKPVSSRQLLETVAQLLNIPERKSWRVLLKVSVSWRSASGIFLCSSRDISATGILLQTDRMLAVGDVISCDFYLPHSLRVFTNVEIMRVTINDDDTFLYGAKYIDLDPKYRSAIEEFINE